MAQRLTTGETLTATTLVRATPAEVYAIVSDVTRTPEWSPETRRCEWVDDTRFRSWNGRRFGRWRTTSRVVARRPEETFSYVVTIPALGGDWTQWTFDLEPGPEAGTTRLRQHFRMCRDMPTSVMLFERLLMRVPDRRSDLQSNLEQSLERIMRLAEPGATGARPGRADSP